MGAEGSLMHVGSKLTPLLGNELSLHVTAPFVLGLSYFLFFALGVLGQRLHRGVGWRLCLTHTQRNLEVVSLPKVFFWCRATVSTYFLLQ